VGVIIYQLPGQETPFSSLGAANTGIPAVMVGYSDGVALKASAGQSVSLDQAWTASDTTANTIWAASSRGPNPGAFAVTQIYAIKPELVATGVNILTATQKLDPNGDGYNPSGYGAFTGTSYAVPMVAGAVALVKQKFPSMTPAQLKSAVVNTATQDVSDETSTPARVNSVGTGKLSAGDAVNVAATLDPPTIEFGAIAAGALPINRTVTIKNVSSNSATFTFSVQARDSSAANVQVTPSTITLAAGQQNTVTVGLTGTRPGAGSYEGAILVSGGGGPTLRMPYQFLVGTNVPAVAFPIGNGGFLGGTNDTGWELDMRVTDQYGVPVVGTPLAFHVLQGGGKITAGDQQSFRLGNAAAIVNLGTNQGDQTFNATIGNLTVEFDGFARLYPTISPNKVVDAATQTVGQGLAPGSYISIYGVALSDATEVESTTSLPVALADVTVSFDGGGLSLPGHLHFVSPGQINVQIPWEFQGQSSVTMHVITGIGAAGFLNSTNYTVPLAPVSPGIFAVLPNSVKRGDAIVIYMNGLGAVSNQPASGEPAPGPPNLATTNATPTVTIGGVQAQVLFSGMTPGAVGLYQVNAIVPSNTPTGNQSLTVSVNGVTSQASNLAVQ